MSAQLECARRLHAAEISVIPIGLGGAKIPVTEWEPFQERRPTLGELEEWFDNGRRLGLGAVCGRVSGNLEIIDHDDAELFPRWKELVANEAPQILPKLVIIRTPRPGYQIWYRCEGPVEGNQKLARRQVGTDAKGNPKLKTLIETRGEGGYAVAPGSPVEVHENRRPYETLQGDPAAPPVLTAAERALLLNAARSLNEYVEPERYCPGGPTKPRPEGAGLRPGDDFNARGDFEELLRKHGWTKARQIGGASYWRRPDKDRGWSATLGHVAPGILYVFSSNAAPLEDGRAYDLFGAYTFLEHHGDFPAAAKALSAEGHGDRQTSEKDPAADKRNDAAIVEAAIARAAQTGDPAAAYDVVLGLAGLSEIAYSVARDRFKDALGRKLDLRLLDKLVSRQKQRQQEEALDASGKPHILLSNRPTEETTNAALAALYTANDPPGLFARNGKLVRMRWDEKGRPFLEPMTEDSLGDRLSCVARFLKRTNRGLEHTKPPPEIVGYVLGRPSWNLPAITGVIECPVLRPDGSVVTKPGYDPPTRLFYAPAPELRVPVIPPEPTAEEATAAANYLISNLLDGFPFILDAESFENTSASKANALAMLLTPLLRPAICGNVPLGLIDKPQGGTGGSLFAEVICLLATGQNAPMTTAPAKEEEWSKTITALLRPGSSLILLDNVGHKLESDNLATALTAGEWTSRVITTPDIARLPQAAVWYATGNNIQLGGQMPRRCYKSRMNARCERPEERDPSIFPQPELLPFVRENRGRLLTAALTLIRRWFVLGCPSVSTLKPMVRFEEWSHTLAGVLSVAGVVGFRDNGRELYERSNTEATQAAAFFAAWHRIRGKEPITTSDLVSRLVPHPERKPSDDATHGRLLDALPDKLRDDLEGGTFRVRFGLWLDSCRDGHFGGYVLQPAGRTRTNVALWRVVKSDEARHEEEELQGSQGS